MTKLSNLEQEALDTLMQVRDYFYPGQSVTRVGRERFTRVMGKVRDTIIHLENKMFGCVTGKHSSECWCDQGMEICTSYRPKDPAEKKKLRKWRSLVS